MFSIFGVVDDHQLLKRFRTDAMIEIFAWCSQLLPQNDFLLDV